VIDNPYYNAMGSPERRAQYEYRLALDCILPLMSQWGIDIKGMKVLDMGCGDGGLAVALADSGAHCLGIDHNEQRIAQALNMAAHHGVDAQFLLADVLKMDHFEKRFDLMILSEVVEHLVNFSNVKALLCWCRQHLVPGGRLYISFPPWFSPFAGHQAGWPGIRCVPWYHLLPDTLKRLFVPKHAPRYIKFIQELNHLTISAFEQIVEQAGLIIIRQELFLLRPEFYWRYGVPTLRSPSFLAKVPIVREVVATGAFYLLSRPKFWSKLQATPPKIKQMGVR